MKWFFLLKCELCDQRYTVNIHEVLSDATAQQRIDRVRGHLPVHRCEEVNKGCPRFGVARVIGIYAQRE